MSATTCAREHAAGLAGGRALSDRVSLRSHRGAVRPRSRSGRRRREIGLPMARAAAVNDDPLFLDMTADVVLDLVARHIDRAGLCKSSRETQGCRQRQDAARIRVLPDRTDRPALRARIHAGADAETDASPGRLRREVHDRLPRRVSRELVYARKAVRRAARRQVELLRRQRVAVARGVAAQRLDPSPGSARLVSVVLPLLHRAAARRTMHGRSGDGGRSRGTCRRSGRTASRATSSAAAGNDRRYCIGHTTAAGFSTA